MNLDARIPSGPLAQKWDRHRFELKLVNPANKRKFDVIVSDVMMPRLDGFEFARAVKSNPDLCAVPILFLTARGSPTDQVEGIQAGARSYLTKPFKVKDLLAAVARASRRGPR